MRKLLGIAQGFAQSYNSPGLEQHRRVRLSCAMNPRQCSATQPIIRPHRASIGHPTPKVAAWPPLVDRESHATSEDSNRRSRSTAARSRRMHSRSSSLERAWALASARRSSESRGISVAVPGLSAFLVTTRSTRYCVAKMSANCVANTGTPNLRLPKISFISRHYRRNCLKIWLGW